MSEENKPQKNPIALREEAILEFWNREGIFEKSLQKKAPKGDFVFYDGPPFATGLPHFGHLLPTSIKDVIPRYKTMQGYRVRRRWGWDCHGLPVENLVEKELGLKTKKDILDYGIGRFNAAAEAIVRRYVHDWKKIIPRLGRWVDMENDYETMNPSYTESVWWAFHELHKKGLVYEGFKAMQLCPRCETTLSNFEVNQGYKDITDISVYVKFELKNEPGTFFIAWTTTPWTLPGNVALVVNSDIDYVQVRLEGPTPGKYILAKDKVDALFKESVAKGGTVVIEKEMKGKELVGIEYIPVFDYYTNPAQLPSAAKPLVSNAWKVYAAEYVTLEKGTGIVHIAPAFGEEDLALSVAEKLPVIHHVGTDGKFKKEVTDFAGQTAKPKEDHQKSDIEIIKYLANNPRGSLLFAKEKIIHSYPHCWRCDTPLLNYASSSWFVKVTSIKDKLVAENKTVKWMPEEVGEGRFGNWLLGARDWAISRSRFWGAPIPVWQTEDGQERFFIGGLDDLKKYSKAKNTYFVMRHGEAENNIKGIVSADAKAPHHLTENGKQQAKQGAQSLKGKKIDFIFISPFVRTLETAKILINELGVSKDKIIIEPRIHEIKAGDFNGKPLKELRAFFQNEDGSGTYSPHHFSKVLPNGESYADIQKRMGDFLYDLEKKYEGKTILIITHDSPAWLTFAAARGLNEEQAIALRGTADHFLLNAEVRPLELAPLPHNQHHVLDLHRPFIDEVQLMSPSGKKLHRVAEVFDCWFESGSMPYAEAHYPFEKTEFDPKGGFLASLFGKKKGYPADFIAEGVDQTRGWFYSMLVLGTALFGKSPYKNVIVNGLVLAEDGQKMSKSKQNYPDLAPTIDAFGADALRYYLLASPLVRAQEFCFSQKGVDEVAKKHIGRLWNVVTFYLMYADSATGEAPENPKSADVLDQWIIARLNELKIEVTDGLEKFELDKAARPFAGFIDDLSTWYIRRSRDRYKGDDVDDRKAALDTTAFVLVETSKLLAPFMPFLAEDMYRQVVGQSAETSVHLVAWPVIEKQSPAEIALLADMTQVRLLTTLGLDARTKAKVNVRQPLAKLTVKKTAANARLAADTKLAALVLDEVNVREIVWTETGEVEVELDLALTPELKEEGQVRELMRAIQDMRKKNGYTISDTAVLEVVADTAGKNLVEKYRVLISKTTGLSGIEFDAKAGEKVVIEGVEVSIALRK